MSGRILIIDGNSLINRAFFAVQGLLAKDGTPTNAIFGFRQMLNRLKSDFDPQYITVAFDLKAPTFRHLAYANYKGTRKGMPDELRVQMPLIKEMLDAMGIHRLEWEGYEADDLIGTVGKRAGEMGLEVYIATGDRDSLQLVDDQIRIVYHGTKGNRIYDRAAVIEDYGITPEQLTDHKALTGDVSDNIPGVPGIGKVTATKLIQQFGNLEELLQRLDDVSPARIQNLIREHVEDAVLSKKLGVIFTDIPLVLELDELKYPDAVSPELGAFYRRMGFKPLPSELVVEEESVANPATLLAGSELLNWLQQDHTNGPVTISAVGEIGNVRTNRCQALLLKPAGCPTIVIQGSVIDENHQALQAYFDKIAHGIEGHQVKRDILLLRNHGVLLNAPGFDSSIAGYLLEPQRKSHELDVLSAEYLGTPIVDSAVHMKLETETAALWYPDFFVDATRRMEGLESLNQSLKKVLSDHGLQELFEQIEMPLVEVLADVEYEGFQVDAPALAEIGKELDGKLSILTASIYEHAGETFNINSPKQLGVILFEKLNLPAGKKTKTGYGTGQDILDKLKFEHPIVQQILEYRTYSKLKSTYVDGLFAVINPETGRIHTSLNQTVTATGRLSSTEPNLQNIPVRIEEGRKIRRVFIPRDSNHILTDADYSQIELRILAHMANDAGLIQAFNEDADIHTATAAKVFGLEPEFVTPLERSRAKEVNFGVIYGMSDFGLSDNLGISRKKAKEYIDQYFAQYPGVRHFMDEVVRQCKETGYARTYFNRRRPIPEIHSSNFNLRSFGERTAMNTPIQGTAADIMKIAMIRTWQAIRKQGLKSRLILQVHDELLVDTHLEEVDVVTALLRDAMEHAADLQVRLKVDLKTGNSWYETK